MNATKQGHNAGQSTRRVVDKATHTAYEGGKTVLTAASGFIKGFLAPADAYVVPRAKRTTRSAKAK